MATPVATTQVADNSAFGGPSASQAATANTSIGNPTAPQPISVTSAQTPASPVVIPPVAPINTGATANAGIPIPSIDSIVSKAVQPTATDITQSSLLNQIAQITGNQQSLSTQQVNQENQAGVPALNTTLNGLNTQLQGLNDQATKLQLDASQGGTIQNQEQLAGTGLRSQQGINTLTNADLRNNQIQQAAIASQALTVKSAVYAAQGQYTIAKQAADQAAQVAFDASTQQINGLQAQLAAIAPALSKEQAAESATLQAQLADRATQLQNQQTDFKTGQALAIAAMQNNPTDHAAQYAAQQAMQISPTDPQYLQKVTSLVGQYQNNPIDNQLKQAQLANTQANTAKTYNDIANSVGTQNATALQPYLQTSFGGTQYADLSSLSPTDKAKMAQVATQAGIKPILDAGTAAKLNAISVSKTNLDNIMGQVSGILNSTEQPSSQGIGNSLKSFFGNSDIKAFNSWRTAVINNVQALAGGQGSGLRINQAEIDAALKNDLPVITGVGADNLQSAQQKIANLNSQLDSWTKQILGGGNQAPTNSAVIPTAQIPAGYYQASDGLLYKK